MYQGNREDRNIDLRDCQLLLLNLDPAGLKENYLRNPARESQYITVGEVRQ